jgi:hypothetical protein
MLELFESDHVLAGLFILATLAILLMVGFAVSAGPRRRGRMHAEPIHTKPKYFLTHHISREIRDGHTAHG